MLDRTEIMVKREAWSDGVSVYCRQRRDDGFYIAEPVTFKKIESGLCQDPFLRIGIEQAQQFIDELWQCGLRPSEGSGSAGSLRATEKHLDDFRKIAFKQLGIKA